MKVKPIHFVIFASVIFVFSCRKTPENPTGGNKIEIGQSVIDNIGYFDSKITTTITNLGGNTISQHGHCWSLSENPTIADFKTSKGAMNQSTSFYSELTTLTPNTKYYIRPYLTYAQGTVYGSQLSITTLQTAKPVVTTKEITDITLYSAISGGTVTSNGGLTVTQRGICWSTNQSFDLATSLSSTNNGTGFGIYASNMLDLLAGTTYYVKAYATNAAGTSYGQTLSFTTATIATPTVSTSEISNITINSAQSGGNLTSDGNGTISEKGIVWSTTQNPTKETNDGLTSNGDGIGEFTSNLIDLIDGTTYYVRAYATNEKGTGYGEEIQFSTIEITAPTVSTTDVSNITSTSAISGGNVSNDGNGIVAARGIVWSTYQNPTIESSEGQTSDGEGIGEFISSLSDLTEGITYYVRAFATNEKDTGYGQEMVFETNIDACDKQLSINYGNQTYNTVSIGNQCWMKENLNIGTRINHTLYMSNNQSLEKYCYNDDEANCDKYGGLYQWDEIMQYTKQESTQGICPDGWHMPSDSEWTELSDFLIINGYGSGNYAYSGRDIGKSMATTSGWDVSTKEFTVGNDQESNNSSGFSGLPAGDLYTYESLFEGLGNKGLWWSSSEYSNSNAWYRTLRGYGFYFYQIWVGKSFGLSVRCIKD
jgi:uncharacterized protein (TIGR02145 family)